MSVTNLAVGQQINLAQVLNTKLEAPLHQSEMGLDAAATANGQAIRYDEFSKRHNSSGQLIPMNYNKSSVTLPSATANTYGSAAVFTPATNFLGIYPRDIDVVFGGTFNSETVTALITATYNDGTTGSVTKTATGTGTQSLINSDFLSLVKDGCYIVQVTYQCKSTIANSAATVTFNRYGMYL